MIAYLNGILAEIEEENIVIEVNGIGYNVRIPAGMAGRLPQIGEVVKLYTYTSVREDAIGLYGFLSRDDLNMYRQLITVSGIGPKAGIAILSVMTGNDLRYAIMAGDSKSISKAPGVGAKTAQKVILELKDKLKVEDMLNTSEEPEIVSNTGNTERINEAVLALAALGYSQTDAMRAVRQCSIAEGMSVEELLKLALKQMLK